MSTGSRVLAEAGEPKTEAPTLWPTSTVGAKFVVALTGAGLTLFVIFHMLGNLQVFLGPEVLNRYAQFLKENPELLWPARIGLLLLFVVHIALTIQLQIRNRAARPVNYVYRQQYLSADLASRTMLLTGLVILAFVIYHLLHFTVGFVQPQNFHREEITDPKKRQAYETMAGHAAREAYRKELDPLYKRHDVYSMVVLGFRDWRIAVSYIIAQLFLGLHLWHAVPSLFQSLGINQPRWWSAIRSLGAAITVVVVAGNISIPLAILLRLVGASVSADAP